MTWEQLSIDKPHLAYMIIGGFTSLFMLCSLFVKEKLYIGEATVATICGLIFGPHAADLFSPISWGNTDKITLELSRIVLVVQCFAVGVELPKAYMERHWRSVAFLLLPVMTVGWLMTSLFIWWAIDPLSWLESLAVAACVTATDPVLASSVVGKGKFAKRVPKHLRDLLSAESGCNDGMAFPFIYLSLYLIRYHLGGRDVVFHWVCLTILYECIFGAVYGFLLGYAGRHLIKYSHRHSLIDRESFLVFYFVLALFCAGSGSLLGLDDLLVGFACGVGFSNDGWFTQQTEDSHVSNVIDLLLNLAYFVYFGSIVPWDQFNNPALGIVPWRLVILALLVLFFRRIPVMLALKPIIPDVKNWREALFAGHFGPIGVGAIFAAILTRAELETDSTQPLAELPTDPESENYLLVQVIWPVVSFLVITSIIVHGSSIAVFTLGKRINTLTLTMSYTQANDPSWLNRLPRIASMGKSQSKSKGDWDDNSEADDPEYPSATLSPSHLPGNFLRRQKEDENPSRGGSRSSSLRPRHRKKYESGMGPGGPISASAIKPVRRTGEIQSPNSEKTRTEASPDSEDTLKSDRKSSNEKDTDSQSTGEPELEAYQEGDQLIVEDEEGNVLHTEQTNHESKEEEKQHIEETREKLKNDMSGNFTKHKNQPHEGNDIGGNVEDAMVEGLDESRVGGRHKLRKKISEWRHRGEPQIESDAPKRGPARAYQYGNTIIIEDEDGEVVKKYDLPASERKRSVAVGSSAEAADDKEVGNSLRRLSTWVGLGGGKEPNQDEKAEDTDGRPNPRRKQSMRPEDNHEDDHRIRFTVGGNKRRLTKADFIKEIQQLDPKAQARAVDGSDAPDGIKRDMKHLAATKERHQNSQSATPDDYERSADEYGPEIQKSSSMNSDHSADLELINSNTSQPIPFHPVSESLKKYQDSHGGETAAQRRRRLAAEGSEGEASSSRQAASKANARPTITHGRTSSSRDRRPVQSKLDDGETAAERKRRLAALGQAPAQESDSDEDGAERQPKQGHKPIEEPIKSPGIRFADSPVPTRGRR